jgi:hypothetical protein
MRTAGVASVANALSAMTVEQAADAPLSVVFHQHGVNMRYLLAVAEACSSPSMQRFLVEEAFVRTAKHQIRALLRTAASEAHAVRLLVSCVQTLAKSRRAWKELRVAVALAFGGAVPLSPLMSAQLDAIVRQPNEWMWSDRILAAAGASLKPGAKVPVVVHARGPSSVFVTPVNSVPVTPNTPEEPVGLLPRERKSSADEAFSRQTSGQGLSRQTSQESQSLSSDLVIVALDQPKCGPLGNAALAAAADALRLDASGSVVEMEPFLPLKEQEAVMVAALEREPDDGALLMQLVNLYALMGAADDGAPVMERLLALHRRGGARWRAPPSSVADAARLRSACSRRAARGGPVLLPAG